MLLEQSSQIKTELSTILVIAVSCQNRLGRFFQIKLTACGYNVTLVESKEPVNKPENHTQSNLSTYISLISEIGNREFISVLFCMIASIHPHYRTSLNICARIILKLKLSFQLAACMKMNGVIWMNAM